MTQNKWVGPTCQPHRPRVIHSKVGLTSLRTCFFFNTQPGVIQKKKKKRVTCGQKAPSDSSLHHTCMTWVLVLCLLRLALSVRDRVSYAIFSLHCKNINAAAKAQNVHNTDTPTLPTSHLSITPTNLWHTTQHTNLIYLWIMDLIVVMSLKIST